MIDEYSSKFDFTGAAWESFYDTVDSNLFADMDSELIYDSLKKRLKIIPFGDYLKRYIYIKAGLEGDYDELPISDYQMIIKESFNDNFTPPSFHPTSAKLSALAKNWLTQQTVKRSAVFLLGFGLNMSVEDVNIFLTKALREQEINPKNPFEAACWYCYKKRYNFLKFKQLWEVYKLTPPNQIDPDALLNEYTVGVRNNLYSVNDDAHLIAYISRLKNDENKSRMSVTAKDYFDRLYKESRRIVAELYNATEEESHQRALSEYKRRLVENDRLFDYQIAEKIEKFASSKKVYTAEDISESDIEHIICSAIPTDRHGNLTPGKASKLNEQFAGKRFSRQRIGEICSGKVEINRFDLITLNFFIFSQKTDEYPNPKNRFLEFIDSTNKILNRCSMGEIYAPNPYECFVLMCILSEDPLGTYADVWELSYDPDQI